LSILLNEFETFSNGNISEYVTHQKDLKVYLPLIQKKTVSIHLQSISTGDTMANKF